MTIFVATHFVDADQVACSANCCYTESPFTLYKEGHYSLVDYIGALLIVTFHLITYKVCLQKSRYVSLVFRNTLFYNVDPVNNRIPSNVVFFESRVVTR